MTTDVTNLESMEVTLPPTLVAECRATSTADSSAISAAVGRAFERIHAFQQTNGITAAGPPRVVYTEWSPAGVHFTAAIPIAAAPPNVSTSPDVSIATIPETQALRFQHRGPYREIRTTYGRIEAWLRARGGIKAPSDWARYSPMWDEYMSDPATTPESELLTRIYLTLP